MPTLQTRRESVMPLERRHAIAEIVRSTTLICWKTTPTISAVAAAAAVSAQFPNAVFTIVSFAKCLAPGLRIAAMIAPEAFRDRSINALRATGWMAVPVMAEVVARLIRNGGLARQANSSATRPHCADAIVRRILKEWLASLGGNTRLSHLAFRCPPAARWRR